MGYNRRYSNMTDVDFRIEALEHKVEKMTQDIEAIMQERLPSIRIEIECLRGEIKALATQMRIYGAIIMIALGAVITLVVAG